MKNKIKNAYDTLGKHYYNSRKDKSGSSYFYNELLEMPATLKLIGNNIKGKKILDIGCGPGIYAGILKKKSAIVKGIDISKELIRIAKKECPRCEFILGSADKLPYNNSEFDLVIATLVLDHIEDWNPIFKEVRRVLKKEGIFIFSVYNPVTKSLIKKKWFFKKFKIINNYFKEGWHEGKWQEPEKEAKIIHHHKTYSTIIKTITKNQFKIIDYEDSYPLSADNKLFAKHYKEWSNIPKFCSWKLQKLKSKSIKR